MNFTVVLLILLLPMAGALLSLFFGEGKQKERSCFASAITLCTFLAALALIPQVLKAPIRYDFWKMFGINGMVLGLNIDYLGLFMLCLISFLGFLATIYSSVYMTKYKGLRRYYFLLFIFIGAMNGTVIAGDLVSFFFFWELMTISSFLLVIFDGTEEARRAGIKYFIMTAIGALFMLFSISSVYAMTGTMNIPELMARGISVNSGFVSMVVLFFLIGLGVKAGMVPLHTWLPDAHPAAPSPISALLSGVMIKVGIYMLVRVFFQIFSITVSWSLIFSFLGVITILIGVIFALVQHDAKRLLAFHSVSQIGYMILGISLGTAMGTAGALFHMVNHAFFKGLLFLGMGAVIYKTGERDLDKLGGLSRTMPLAFITCMVASLAISGVPPFNGFVSKWIIYQALLEKANPIYLIFLAAAMFGSALTLASFMKFIHAVFLGQRTAPVSNKIHWTMGLPMVVLAGLCIIFGVFAQLPLRYVIGPIVNMKFAGLGRAIEIVGFYNPTLTGGLMIIGIIVGLIIYLLSSCKAVRTADVYIGGEVLDEETMNISGVHFYDTIKSMKPFAYIYEKGEKGKFDPYHIAIDGVEGSARFIFKYIAVSMDKFYSAAGKIGSFFIELLRKLHSGVLPRYIFWCLAGLVIFLFSMMR